MLTIEEITEWVKQHGEDGGEVDVRPVGDRGSIVFDMWFRNEINRGVCLEVKDDGYTSFTVFDVIHLSDEDIENPEVLSQFLWVGSAANLTPLLVSGWVSGPGHIGHSVMLTALRRPLDIDEFEADMKEFSTNVLIAHRHLHEDDENE